MEFGSGTNYIQVRALGAQAIIFHDAGNVTRSEAAKKFLQVPVDIPRFWINKSNAKKIKAMIATAESKREKITVRLKSTMTWERRTGQNIRGYHERRKPHIKAQMKIINA